MYGVKNTGETNLCCQTQDSGYLYASRVPLMTRQVSEEAF